MTPLEDFIGQERAMRAIQFGLGSGQTGIQYFRHRTYWNRQNQYHQSFLKKITAERIPADADSPFPRIGATSTTLMIRIGLRCLRSTAVGARVLKADMEKLS